jgi:hypothetical protein
VDVRDRFYSTFQTTLYLPKEEKSDIYATDSLF